MKSICNELQNKIKVEIDTGFFVKIMRQQRGFDELINTGLKTEWCEIKSNALNIWKSVSGPYKGMVILRTDINHIKYENGIPMFLVLCSQAISKSVKCYQEHTKENYRSFVGFDLSAELPTLKCFVIEIVMTFDFISINHKSYLAS